MVRTMKVGVVIGAMGGGVCGGGSSARVFMTSNEPDVREDDRPVEQEVVKKSWNTWNWAR